MNFIPTYIMILVNFWVPPSFFPFNPEEQKVSTNIKKQPKQMLKNVDTINTVQFTFK